MDRAYETSSTITTSCVVRPCIGDKNNNVTFTLRYVT